MCLITQDEAWRRGTTVPLKSNVDEALNKTETIRTVVVVRRTGNDVPMKEGRDHWYHDLVAAQGATCEPEAMDSRQGGVAGTRSYRTWSMRVSTQS